MKSVVIVLFALFALAASQSYVRVASYGPNDACGGTELGSYSYMLEGACATIGQHSQMVWVNATTSEITLWLCNNLDCNATGCVEFNLLPNQCYAEIDNNNVTFGYESYMINADPMADFSALPFNSLLTVMYGAGSNGFCNTSFIYGHVAFSGHLCAPQGASFANLQCSSGCLTVQSACSMNDTTDQCINCPNGPNAVATGCIAPFNSYIACGPWGAQTCNSTMSTTTGGSTTGALTTGGGITTGPASTTTGHATTTGAGTTTGHGTTTGAGTTSSAQVTTTGSAASVALSGVAVLVAVVAVFL